MPVFSRNVIAGRSRLATGYNLFVLLAFSITLILGCGGGGGSSSGGSSGEGGGSPASDGVIQLAWDSNTEEDLAGYRVYYGTHSGTYDHSIDVGMATTWGSSTTYSLTNLIGGQTYCIAVTAYDTSINESDFSDEVCGNAW